MLDANSLILDILKAKIERQFIGVSSQIKEIFEMAVIAANYPDVNVLITGESGTGKENIARIIHYSSNRKNHAFCAVNSSAFSDSLIESEFFGHKKGSFTGAFTDKVGFFEACDKGTLFLDEIADMPLNLQSKLLRAVEEKMITRVGDTTSIASDFRVISATNRNIDQRVAEKKFRLDLLHRLNTLHIHIPPLRERPEDIKPLLINFVDIYSVKFNKPHIHIAKEVYESLLKYEFPGNVRELRNMCERAVILCKSDLLGIADFQIKERNADKSEAKYESYNLKAQEVKMIRMALVRFKFNQQEAANALGIHRDALSRKMMKYDIKIERRQE